MGHDTVLSLLMGHKARPLCMACLARFSEEEPGDLVKRSHRHLARLDCYFAGWQYSDKKYVELGLPRPDYLGELSESEPITDSDPSPSQSNTSAGAPASATDWDAGDMGCGDLVLELRTRVAELEPGAVLQITATDPGAHGDLPAWCRVTKNPLVHQEHPRYWIQRRDPNAPL